MPTPEQIDRAIQDLLESTPPPEWLVDMISYYRETGAFRPEDMQRFVGDLTKGALVGPDATVEGILAQQY